jgi:hypothetical protein
MQEQRAHACIVKLPFAGDANTLRLFCGRRLHFHRVAGKLKILAPPRSVSRQPTVFVLEILGILENNRVWQVSLKASTKHCSTRI